MHLEIGGIILALDEFKGVTPFAGPHRILGIDSTRDLIALFAVSPPLKAPKVYRFTEIESLVDEGKLIEGNVLTPRSLLSKNGLGAKGAAGDFSLRRSGAVQS